MTARWGALVLVCGCGAGEVEVPVNVASSGNSSAGNGPGGSNSDGRGSDDGSPGSESTGDGNGGAPNVGDNGTDGKGPIFDDAPSPGANEGAACDKVDFLYVVDNSASMVDKQASLARSFLGFSSIVTQTLGTNDHHVMVIDTDADNINERLSRDTVGGPQCVGALGVGRRVGGEGEDCGVEGSQRYLLDNQRNLAATFECLAKVGIYGNVDERAIDAMLTATSAIVNDVDECNAGFLRDDAVLVVTLITDEDDNGSNGNPEFWKRMLVRAKGGNEEAVVMLGLIADNHIPGGLPGGPCDEFGGSPSPRLESFVRSFELGSIGSVCAPDYSVFFADAVSSIDTACDQFVPR
jgi:hypothetical protein